MEQEYENGYDRYAVKVPRYDKDGNDISENIPTSGGRRRNDGTFSGLAYDFEPLDSEYDYNNRRLESETQLAEYDYNREMAEIQMEQAKIDLENNVLTLICNVIEFCIENPEVVLTAIEKGADAVKIVKAQTGRFTSFIKEKVKPRKKYATIHTNGRPVPSIAVAEPADDNIVEMTLEKAQNEYIEILKDYCRIRKRMEKLANARITDANVQKLDTEQMLSHMNLLVEKYPLLLDDNTYSQIFEILKANNNASENHAILAALNINTDRINYK